MSLAQEFPHNNQPLNAASTPRRIPLEYGTITFDPPIIRDAGGLKVTPTGGTFQYQATARLAPDDVWQNIADGGFDAADAYSPDRKQPSGYGNFTAYRVVATGVTGNSAVTVDYSAYGKTI